MRNAHSYNIKEMPAHPSCASSSRSVLYRDSLRARSRLLTQAKVETPDDRVGIINGDGPYVGQGLNLGSAETVVSKIHISGDGETYTSFTWSSVMLRPSCPTRVFTAFHPVSREAKWT